MAQLNLTDPVPGTRVQASLHAGNNTLIESFINGGLTNEHINALAAIVVSKLAAGTEGYVLKSVSGVPTWSVEAAVAASAVSGSGTIWFTATPPSGWLLLDGNNISRTTYSALFSLWGTTFGIGDGSTTFGIPDMRGRVPVGVGTHVDVNSITSNDGLGVGARRPKHRHTLNWSDPGHGHGVSDPGHRHSITYRGGGGLDIPVMLADGTNIPVNDGRGTETSGTGISIGVSGTGISASVGPQTGNEPVDGPGYRTVYWIVKT